MIPGYITGCKNIDIDLGSSTYNEINAQFKTNNHQCPFCTTTIYCFDPKNYFDPCLGCLTCRYEIQIGSNSERIKAIKYRDTNLGIKDSNNQVGKLQLTYKPAHKWGLPANPSHVWTVDNPTKFTLKDLLNKINLLDLRIDAEIRSRAK